MYLIIDAACAIDIIRKWDDADVFNPCCLSSVPGQVRHSQHASETPLHCWLISASDGQILCAHCNCMAGLGKTCTHIAACLFRLEATFRLQDQQSCTGQLCGWVMPTYNVKPIASSPSLSSMRRHIAEGMQSMFTYQLANDGLPSNSSVCQLRETRSASIMSRSSTSESGTGQSCQSGTASTVSEHGLPASNGAKKSRRVSLQCWEDESIDSALDPSFGGKLKLVQFDWPSPGLHLSNFHLASDMDNRPSDAEEDQYKQGSHALHMSACSASSAPVSSLPSSVSLLAAQTSCLTGTFPSRPSFTGSSFSSGMHEAPSRPRLRSPAPTVIHSASSLIQPVPPRSTSLLPSLPSILSRVSHTSQSSSLACCRPGCSFSVLLRICPCGHRFHHMCTTDEDGKLCMCCNN